MANWPDQLDRVERCLERIHNAKQQNRDVTEQEDALWTFFLHCWHLKDWILSDPDLAGSVDPGELEQAVEDSHALSVVAGLARRTKGLGLERSRRESELVSAQSAISLREVLGRGETSSEEQWDWKVIVPDGPDRWALDVARDAVADWRWIVSELEISDDEASDFESSDRDEGAG